MTALPQWVVFSVEWKEDGKKRVLPLNPRTLRMASSTDSRTWDTYEVALAKAKEQKMELGFAFTKEDGLVALDFDEPTSAEEQANHTAVYNSVVSYTEYSVSGKGVHIICKGSIPHAVKRNHVEIYDWGRFFIMTGKHVEGRPKTIEDCNEVVNAVVEQAGGKSASSYTDESEPQAQEDQAVLERCFSSANGDKFKWLWDGNFAPTYSSQSEADYALLNMLVFSTPNDEQCRRLFRLSGLGKRDKAMRDDYLNGMIGIVREEQNPTVDLSKFKAPPIASIIVSQPPLPDTLETLAPVQHKQENSVVKFPDGLVGEMAQYILDTAIRPVPQVALAGALGLAAGISGRTYNISHTGLNLYLMLVAGTGIGKEGSSQGVTRLIKSVMPKLPAIQQYLGPTEYASGQAMIKQLHQFPCQVSVLSEFGLTLRRICSANANGADIMWRKVLLDVYNKSGAGDMLGSMVYSDTGKNTPTVFSPALTLLTESSPASLYEGLDEQAIETGLVPRFILMECNNKRPPTNPHAFTPPSKQLAARLEAVAHRCLSMEANNTHQNIKIAPDALKLLQDFDVEVDGHINAQNDDAVRQIWNRAHLKALRVSGVLAVGLGADNPTVDAASVHWAMDLVRQDARNMLKRFGEGVGQGDSVQLIKLRHILVLILQSTSKDSPSKKMKQNNVVPHGLLIDRAHGYACFRNDRRGASDSVKRAIQSLTDGGEIVLLLSSQTKQEFGVGGKSYMLTRDFKVSR